MNRRTWLQSAAAIAGGSSLNAALRRATPEEAGDILAAAVEKGVVKAAVLHVADAKATWTRSFGQAKNADAMFLLGSISKPIAVTALMTLYDQGEFKLDDLLKKFLPQFDGEGRERVTMRHLLTHVSGLPDQLAENDALRRKHAGLSEFVEHALRTPLQFAAGSRYQYSSMGILLAARVAERISGTDILTLVDRAVFRPLKMEHSAQGLGDFQLKDLLAVQTERAAPESGGGDPNAKDWDWNSAYWRKLGAPWGGTHASALDLGKFLNEFLFARGVVVKAETAQLMVANHNGPDLMPRGLGWNVGATAGGKGCSDKSFGHSGSTGTLAWADPVTQAVCVVLTTLPARAVQPHPRDLAAARVAG